MLRVRIGAKARALVLALAGLGALLVQTHYVSAQGIVHTAASLSRARDEFAATSVGDYALFGGG
jgi:hypothetical protein